MTLDETVEILGMVKAEWPHSFRGMSRKDGEAKLKLWAESFESDSFERVNTAIKSLIASGGCEYAPNVGAIKAEMKKAGPRSEKTAWMKAYADDNVCPSGMEKLGNVSRYARGHGITWKEAKEAINET